MSKDELIKRIMELEIERGLLPDKTYLFKLLINARILLQRSD
jgi:hypothetical protein